MVSKDSSRFSILDNLCAMFPSIAASESSNLSIICKKGKIYFTYVHRNKLPSAFSSTNIRSELSLRRKNDSKRISGTELECYLLKHY